MGIIEIVKQKMKDGIICVGVICEELDDGLLCVPMLELQVVLLQRTKISLFPFKPGGFHYV